MGVGVGALCFIIGTDVSLGLLAPEIQLSSARMLVPCTGGIQIIPQIFVNSRGLVFFVLPLAFGTYHLKETCSHSAVKLLQLPFSLHSTLTAAAATDIVSCVNTDSGKHPPCAGLSADLYASPLVNPTTIL